MTEPNTSIVWPQPLETNHARSALAALAADARRAPLVFEAHAHRGRVTYSVAGLRPSGQRRLEQQVPGVHLRLSEAGTPGPLRAARLRLHHPRRPLDVGDPVVKVRTILGALVALAPQYDVAVQIVIGPGRSPHTVPASVADPWQGWFDRAGHGIREADGKTKARLQARADEPHLRADVRFFTSASGHDSEHVIRGLLAASRIIERDGPRFYLAGVERSAIGQRMPPRRFPLTLTVSELVVLLGWPVGSDPLPGQPPAHPRLVVPTTYSAERAFATLPSVEGEPLVGLPESEAKFHTHVLGPTGVGKSTVLLRLAAADLQANVNVLLVDPKADTASALLELIPPHRVDDVVVLDPAAANPVPFNPLDARGRDPFVVADSVVEVLTQVFAPIGPRTLDVLNSSVLTLTLTGGTLVDLPDLLLDASARRRRVAQLDDPVLLGFWARFETYSPQQLSDVVGPTMTRLRRVLLRPGLRRMLGTSSGFALSELFAKPSIVIVPTNRGVAGPQAASLLGSLVISTFWNQALAQAERPERARRAVSVFVDEVQDHLRLAGSDLESALSQSRSLNVRWTLAHQYLGQLPREMRDAFEVNARSKIAFQLTKSDSAVMAADSAVLEPADFRALGRFEIYAKLTRDGASQPWFSARTLPPPPRTSDPLEVLARMQERWPATSEPSTPTDPSASPDAGDPAPPVGRKPRGSV